MTRTAIMVCVIAGVAGVAQASSVEFRIVERRGQTSWNPSTSQSVTNDNVLNLSVQARVVGGAPGESLGNFGFNMIMAGESETAGLLTTAAISNASGQYTPGSYSDNSAIGRGGLAHQYSYLAVINPSFNGQINTSSGSWTQTSNNDIGLVAGAPIGSNMLDLFDSSGNSTTPDTYPGTGTTAPVDPTLASQYLGAGGNFISVYNFNYTISNSAARVLHFTLDSTVAQTFSDWAISDNVWGPSDPLDASGITATGLDIAIVPAPGAMALLGLGGLVAARRRRA